MHARSHHLPALALALGALASQVGCAVVAIEDGFVVDEPIDAMFVSLANGELSVAGAEGDVTTVEVEFGGLSFERVGHEVVDGVLYVEFDCALTCGGELDLKVPPGVELYLDLDAGSIDARFDEAPPVLHLDLGAGDASVQVPAGGYAMDLRVGAGEIALDGVWQDDQAETWIHAAVGAGELSVRALDPWDSEPLD